MLPSEIPSRVVDRLRDRVVVDEQTGCHLCTYSVGSHGYTQVGWHTSGVRVMALCHRVAWIAERGPIPEGMTVDHTCKQRRCVNVAHLRLLTNYENARRTSGRDWPLGECVNGHPASELVTQPNGRTVCRLCRREWNRDRAERERGACADCTAPVARHSLRCRSCATRAAWTTRSAS